MSEIKNGGIDQYGAEPFEQQQFGTAGVEVVNRTKPSSGFPSAKTTLISEQVRITALCGTITATPGEY